MKTISSARLNEIHSPILLVLVEFLFCSANQLPSNFSQFFLLWTLNSSISHFFRSVYLKPKIRSSFQLFAMCPFVRSCYAAMYGFCFGVLYITLFIEQQFVPDKSLQMKIVKLNGLNTSCIHHTYARMLHEQLRYHQFFIR